MKVVINDIEYIQKPIQPETVISEDIQNIVFYSSDLDRELSIKDYLKELLLTIWLEGESFSGKRPFGNSGWEYDLYKPLIKAKVIRGKLDSDGYVQELNDKNIKIANKIILNIIKGL